MQHSVKQIANTHASISALRQDKNLFVAADFIKFAQDNIDKYGIFEEGEDLKVSTFHTNDLIKDYKKTIH